jgi:hypothetical protein
MDIPVSAQEPALFALAVLRQRCTIHPHRMLLHTPDPEDWPKFRSHSEDMRLCPESQKMPSPHFQNAVPTRRNVSPARCSEGLDVRLGTSEQIMLKLSPR